MRVLEPVLIIFLVTMIKYDKQLNGERICFSSWFDEYSRWRNYSHKCGSAVVMGTCSHLHESGGQED